MLFATLVHLASYSRFYTLYSHSLLAFQSTFGNQYFAHFVYLSFLFNLLLISFATFRHLMFVYAMFMLRCHYVVSCFKILRYNLLNRQLLFPKVFIHSFNDFSVFYLLQCCPLHLLFYKLLKICCIQTLYSSSRLYMLLDFGSFVRISTPCNWFNIACRNNHFIGLFCINNLTSIKTYRLDI